MLLADSHPKVRWALRTFMEEESGLTIVGDATDYGTLLSQARELQPDLILLEWELEGRPAGTLLSSVRALVLPAHVVVLGGRPESERDALAAGADDFVSKADGPGQLLTVLRRVLTEGGSQ